MNIGGNYYYHHFVVVVVAVIIVVIRTQAAQGDKVPDPNFNSHVM